MQAKPWLKVSLCSVSLFFLGLVLLWKLSSSRHFQFFGDLITQVKTTEKVIALTFDDGPTPEFTQPVLNMLAKANVKATFFVTGAETEKQLSEAKAIVNAGHELGNHSYSHSRMIFKSPDFIAHEVEATDRAIRAAGWKAPILFRPPYGKRLAVLPWYLFKHQRLTVMWDLEPESYAEVAKTPEGIAKYVIDKAQPGSILLLHVMYKSRETSRQALPLIIRGLKKKGFGFVTASELVSLQN